MSPAPPRRDDRLFVRGPFKHYRRRYSRAEVRWGFFTLLPMVAIAGWVGWKGAHPDPRLFATATPKKASSRETSDRKPLPEGLAVKGWTEDSISRFDDDSLYEKIDGRADYYLARGFQELVYASLSLREDPSVTIDIECYDLETTSNALGAYSGERQPGIQTAVTEEGLGHMARNALFVVRGRYYIRAIGSEESERMTQALRRIESSLEEGIPGEPLPWAYELFAGRLGLDPGAVTYTPKNAFSFGFAKNVYSVRLGDGDARLFAAHEGTGEQAAAQARRFRDGFASYGSTMTSAETTWVKDRYLGTLSTAIAKGAWVLGVKGAADERAGRSALARAEQAVEGFKPPVQTASIPEDEVDEY